MDGMLCLPQMWIFAQMRKVLGIDKSVDILDHIQSLPVGPQQDAAYESISELERVAMKEMVPQKGLLELMDYLDLRGVKKAICTRNFEYV